MPYDAYSSHSTGLGIWMIISAVLAVCGAIALHFTFLSKSKEGKFGKFNTFEIFVDLFKDSIL